MRPILYTEGETDFNTYGLGEIDAILAEVTRERNGQYFLYLEYPEKGRLNLEFKEGMQIKANAGVRTYNQTFEISRIVRAVGKPTKVWANHVSQRTLYISMNPRVEIRTASAQTALQMWLSNLVTDEPFAVWSDITTKLSTTWTIDKVANARQALGGVEGSILDTWGGEYEFDNRIIRLHKELGRKVPTVLEYGRNITDLEEERRFDTEYTSIYPYAIERLKDVAPDELEERIVTVRGLVIHGKYRNLYKFPRVLPVNFSSEFEQDEDITPQKLEQLARQYLQSNELGKPKLDIEVSYQDLSKTLDYKDYQTIEEVELCDRIPIYYPDFNIYEHNAKVVAITYDVLLGQNKSLKLGVVGQPFSVSTAGRIEARLKDVEERQKYHDDLVPYLLNGTGNRIWRVEPSEDVDHKVGDVYFRKNGNYQIMYIWNGELWEEVINTEDLDEVSRKLDEVEALSEENQARVNQALERADTALEEAGVGQDLAKEAQALAENVRERAEAIRASVKSQAIRNEMTTRVIGSDGTNVYSDNRTLGDTARLILYEEGKTVIKHNGEGFLSGHEYTLTFWIDSVPRSTLKMGITTRGSTIAEQIKEGLN